MAFDISSARQPGGGGGRPYSTEDITTLVWFLMGAEREGLMFSTYTASQAFEAACRIMQLPADELRARMAQIFPDEE